MSSSKDMGPEPSVLPEGWLARARVLARIRSAALVYDVGHLAVMRAQEADGQDDDARFLGAVADFLEDLLLSSHNTQKSMQMLRQRLAL